MQCIAIWQSRQWKLVLQNLGAKFFTLSKCAEEVATGKRLDQYLVTVDELEKVIGDKIPIADYAKHEKLNTSWQIPIGCNEG